MICTEIVEIRFNERKLSWESHQACMSTSKEEEREKETTIIRRNKLFVKEICYVQVMLRDLHWLRHD